MDIVTIFEKLANSAHYRSRMNELIAEQPEEIKKAFLTNDGESLKKQYSDEGYLANTSHIVQA